MKGSSRNHASGCLLATGVCVLVYAALKPPESDHPVTETMNAVARTVIGLQATTRETEGTDGRTHSPASDSKERPLVLFFIQDGCPCSEAADPFFRRLQAAYGEQASFLGVIDGDLATANAWSARQRTSYPILADPERRIIVARKAERSAYVMLVSRRGAIVALWPGYSSKMLAEVGSRLARLTGQPEVALDTRGAPSEMVSGCTF